MASSASWGLGAAVVSLADARRNRDEARRPISEGRDPIAERQRPDPATVKAVTFGAFVDQLVPELAEGFRNDEHILRHQPVTPLQPRAHPGRAHEEGDAAGGGSPARRARGRSRAWTATPTRACGPMPSATAAAMRFSRPEPSLIESGGCLSEAQMRRLEESAGGWRRPCPAPTGSPEPRNPGRMPGRPPGRRAPGGPRRNWPRGRVRGGATWASFPDDRYVSWRYVSLRGFESRVRGAWRACCPVEGIDDAVAIGMGEKLAHLPVLVLPLGQHHHVDAGVVPRVLGRLLVAELVEGLRASCSSRRQDRCSPRMAGDASPRSTHRIADAT